MHQQASRYEGASTGWWVTSRGTVGVGQSRSQGRRTSDALEANAPPTPSPLIGCAAAVPLVLMLLLAMTGWLPLWLLFVLGFGGASAAGIWAYRLEKPDLDRRSVAYDRQWYCFKCGATFEPNFSHQKNPDVARLSAESGSPAKFGTSNYDRGEYIDRVLSPIQRASRPTSRDEAGLAEIVRRSRNSSGRHTFEPTGMDKGVISRLASLDFIAFDENADQFWVTESGFAMATGNQR